MVVRPIYFFLSLSCCIEQLLGLVISLLNHIKSGYITKDVCSIKMLGAVACLYQVKRPLIIAFGILKVTLRNHHIGDFYLEGGYDIIFELVTLQHDGHPQLKSFTGFMIPALSLINRTQNSQCVCYVRMLFIIDLLLQFESQFAH